MSRLIGFFKPTLFFNSLCYKPRQGESLLESLLLLVGLSTAFIYKISLEDQAVLMACKAGLGVLIFFFIQGFINSLIGILFKVRIHPFQVISCHLWASIFSLIAIILVLFIIGALVQQLRSVGMESIAGIGLFVIPILYLWYLFQGIRVSMQTSVLESGTILVCSLILTLGLQWCLNAVINYFIA